MSEFYDRLAATALRQIDKRGRDVIIRKDGTVPVDPDDPGGPSVPAPVDTAPVKALFIGPGDFSLLERSLVLDMIKRGAKVALIAATAVPGLDMEVQNKLLDGGQVWAIDDVHTLQPGDTKLLYMLEVTQ